MTTNTERDVELVANLHRLAKWVTRANPNATIGLHALQAADRLAALTASQEPLRRALRAVQERCFGPDLNMAHDILSIVVPINDAALNPVVTEGAVKRPDGFVGMHFEECDYFTSRGTKPCTMDCCS